MVRIPLHGDQPAQAPVDFFGLPPAYPNVHGLPEPAEDSAAVLIPAAPPELMNPITGEIVDATSIDDLIDCYEYIDKKDKQLYAVKARIKQLLLDRTEGDAATRRVAGKRRKAKLTMPGESFEQAVLKTLWEKFPQLAEEYLRIESIAVRMREFNKLRGTASDQADLVAFRDALTAASRGRAGLPSISIEE